MKWLYSSIIFLCIVILCMSHYNINQELLQKTLPIQRQVRDAAMLAVSAGNTINPVLALIDSVKASQTLDVLTSMHTAKEINMVCNTDVDRIIEIVYEQKIQITNDVMRIFPNFVPDHPLVNEARLVSQQSR